MGALCGYYVPYYGAAAVHQCHFKVNHYMKQAMCVTSNICNKQTRSGGEVSNKWHHLTLCCTKMKYKPTCVGVKIFYLYACLSTLVLENTCIVLENNCIVLEYSCFVLACTQVQL